MRFPFVRPYVWGWARYLLVTEAPDNTEFYELMGKKHFCFLQTAENGKRAPNSSVKGSGANHYPRAPALPLDTQWHDVVATLFQRRYNAVCPVGTA